LDPGCRQLLAHVARLPDLRSLSLPERRAANRELLNGLGRFSADVDAYDAIVERVGVRVYRPRVQHPAGTVLYLHGGGWVFGSVEESDGECRVLCECSGAVVVSVEYRLAPEHPYPAALDDAATVYRHLAARSDRVVVAGASAGGNLAAALAVRLRDQGGPVPCHQALVLPATSAALDTDSMRRFATGLWLERAQLEELWEAYGSRAALAIDPYASPLATASFDGLPSAHVVVAELDPLRDEGEMYAMRLRRAGADVTLDRHAGMIHGFVSAPAFVPAAEAVWRRVGERIAVALGSLPDIERYRDWPAAPEHTVQER
jgi:acetyl esterase